MNRRIALTIGLVAGLAAAATAAQAQTNIDQGKSPAEIFASDCATCHKTTRGLAAGNNSLTLTSFLREHYTASRDQAAALAAYVLGAGGNQAAPKQKPETEHARAGEEPKAGEARGPARPLRASAKPEEETAKPEDRAPPVSAERHEVRPLAPTQDQKAEQEKPAPAQTSIPAVTTPAAAETPSSAELPEVGPTRSAAAPGPAEPSNNEPVPRDNIPD